MKPRHGWECINSGMDYWNGGILEYWTSSKSLKTSRILPHFVYLMIIALNTITTNLYHACFWEWPHM